MASCCLPIIRRRRHTGMRLRSRSSTFSTTPTTTSLPSWQAWSSKPSNCATRQASTQVACSTSRIRASPIRASRWHASASRASWSSETRASSKRHPRTASSTTSIARSPPHVTHRNAPPILRRASSLCRAGSHRSSAQIWETACRRSSARRRSPRPARSHVAAEVTSRARRCGWWRLGVGRCRLRGTISKLWRPSAPPSPSAVPGRRRAARRRAVLASSILRPRACRCGATLTTHTRWAPRAASALSRRWRWSGSRSRMRSSQRSRTTRAMTATRRWS
mmetsp:Transcript_69879/g.191731  ORF Transcript_69879/g.191731 Transcript_69879/m.191731 type:complete len:278 (+) Transcript_69879:137-970(+)